MVKKIKLKKGFTLIELLGVLIILAIISLITIPIIDNSLSDSRNAAYERAVDSIVNAAKNYSASTDLGYPQRKSPLFVSQLQDEGFLTLDIKSPIDESNMDGCVWYYWDEDHKQYIFEYDNECNIENPTVDITYNEELINDNGWAKENIAVTIVGIGDVKYCISDRDCYPNEMVVNGSNTKFLTEEGSFYICASSTNILGESTNICKNFKLDKTAPTIDGIVPITIDKGGSVDLTSGITVDDNLSGIDGTYTITPNPVDTSTAGTKNVVYSVSDLAGNVTTENRTVKVESEPPVIVFNVEGNPFNSNNWSKENVTVRINVTDNSGLGIKEIKYCKGTGECEPTTTIENGGTVVLEENSATNKICVIATDNNDASSRICSDNYQIDKVLPTIDGMGDITVNSNSSNYTGGGSSNTSYKSNTGQSTTGTIYGVYDMSGGAWEFVMGNMVNSSGNFYSSNAGFSSVPDAKYYDKYTYDSSSTSHGRGKLGDATKETLSSFGSVSGGWYSDHADFASSEPSWFLRGGEYNDGSSAGVFAFSRNRGAGFYRGSTRAVLTP